MADLALSFASQDYDHTRALFDGRVSIPGVRLTPVELVPHEIFQRLLGTRDFDTGELALTLYLSALDRGDTRFIAIPAFPARSFRHSAIFVRTDGKHQRATRSHRQARRRAQFLWLGSGRLGVRRIQR